MDKQKIIIFDTTLRDGEQSPGASMTADEKLQIAQSLEKAGVNVIEAGFAAASQGDLKAIQSIASNIKNSTVCSLARAVKNDIDAAGIAIKNASQPRIHTFIATSDIHMRYKLKMNESEVITAATNAITHALKYTDDVEFDSGNNISFNLQGVIEGWTIGIPKFGEGGSGHLLIPPHLAYGEENSRTRDRSVLIFDIELVGF